METPQNESILIDTNAVVRKVNHGKLFPRPVMWFIRKLVHEEDFNRNFSKGKVGPDFVFDFFKDLGVTLEVIGEENIPSDGLFTFASNHPLGGADAGLEVAWLARKYKDNVIVPANNFLLHIKQLHHYLIPVNKLGNAQSRELAVLLDQAFRSDRQVLYFPAGACSRKIDGQIKDLEWKKTFITKSVETHRDVVPIHIEGHNSNFFYRLSNICDRYVKKVNIAMLFLADEMYKNTGHTFAITIGKPIPWQTFTNEKTPMEWAKTVKEQVYKLQ